MQGIVEVAKFTRATNSKLDLERYWDEKLSRPFALAPRILQGEVTREIYDHYNQEFDDQSSSYVKQELKDMFSEKQKFDHSLEGCVVTVLGPGLGRGLGFAKIMKQNMKMSIELFDISSKAVSMTNAELIKKDISRQSPAKKKLITGAKDDISPDTRLLIMSQFLQVIPRKSMVAIMKMVARHTKAQRDSRTIIVHPFDNDDESAGWGDTTPYTLDELLSPTEAVLGHPLRVTNRKEILYFGLHRYQAITLAF